MIGFFYTYHKWMLSCGTQRGALKEKNICLSIKTVNMKSPEQLINLEATGLLHVFHNLAGYAE